MHFMQLLQIYKATDLNDNMKDEGFIGDFVAGLSTLLLSLHEELSRCAVPVGVVMADSCARVIRQSTGLDGSISPGASGPAWKIQQF